MIRPALLLLLACATRPASPLRVSDDPVATTQGMARGVHRSGVTSYLGIPYAQAERWSLPVEGPAWTGVRRFHTLGPACPQEGQRRMTEDCLFLNVFVPKGTSVGAQRPVLVWIHGGGFRAGQGGESVGRLAQEGLVVVSFNYRLGLLGFRDWAGWTEHDPRNFGQADMVAALRWVHANIAAFGGDPGNVTIGGHSGGGMGVQLMMVDPRARGLFHRAISHAGYGTWPFPRAQNPSAEARASLHIEPLEADARPRELVARVPHFHLPVIGGSDLPEQPAAVFEAGRQAPVPYMAGANSYDGNGTIDGAGYGVAGMMSRYGHDPAVRAAYARDFAVSDHQAMARLFGDMRYVYASWRTVRAMEPLDQPGYLFYYDARSPGAPGAGHGAQYDELLGPGPFALREAWVAFATTGVPAAEGLPPWPAHTAEAPTWMVFSPQAEPVQGKLADRMGVISGLRFPGPEEPKVP